LKIFLFLFLSIFIYAENITIVPPTLANMDNYDKISKQNNNSNYQIIQPSTKDKKIKLSIPTPVNKNINTLNPIITSKNRNLILNKNKKNTNNIIQNDNNKIIYNHIINSNVLDTAINSCRGLKYTYNIAKNKGYEIGLKNSKWEFEKWLKKMKPFLDNLFLIKSYYIENILEPPMINFNSDNKILNNGKTYLKKEGLYTIVRPARFRIPLTWEDFLLSDSLKPADYKIKITYRNFNEDCKVNQNKINENFLNGYEEGRKETLIIYKERLKKLSEYMVKLQRYQYLYLTKKIRPPVITPLITPIKSNKKSLLISQEEYTIVKPAEFNTLIKNWKPFLVEKVNTYTKNKRKLFK